MNEMVKRVAYAVCNAAFPATGDAGGEPCTCDLKGHEPCEFEVAKARAAIAAMREPTEAMINVGYERRLPSEIWRAMIDEALRN